MTQNIHSFPVWWAFFLFIISTIIVFLPLNEIVQFINGESHIGLLGWAIMTLGLSLVGYAWGVDILWYRDKNIGSDSNNE